MSKLAQERGADELADALEIERTHVGIEAFGILAAHGQQADRFTRIAQGNEGDRTHQRSRFAKPGDGFEVVVRTAKGPGQRSRKVAQFLARLGESLALAAAA